MKTRREVDALKREWVLDPCWKLECTQGYEDFYAELLACRLAYETIYGEHTALKSDKLNTHAVSR